MDFYIPDKDLGKYYNYRVGNGIQLVQDNIIINNKQFVSNIFIANY